jgi:hypothetical protein
VTETRTSVASRQAELLCYELYEVAALFGGLVRFYSRSVFPSVFQVQCLPSFPCRLSIAWRLGFGKNGHETYFHFSRRIPMSCMLWAFQVRQDI